MGEIVFDVMDCLSDVRLLFVAQMVSVHAHADTCTYMWLFLYYENRANAPRSKHDALKQ